METVGKATTSPSKTETLQPDVTVSAQQKAQSFDQDVAEKERREREYLEQNILGSAAETSDVDLQATAGELQSKIKTTTDTYMKKVRRWSTSGAEGLTHQVQNFARRHPGLLFGGSLIAGFALTRAFKLTGTGNGTKTGERGYRQSINYPSARGDALPAEEEVFHG